MHLDFYSCSFIFVFETRNQFCLLVVVRGGVLSAFFGSSSVALLGVSRAPQEVHWFAVNFKL